MMRIRHCDACGDALKGSLAYSECSSPIVITHHVWPTENRLYCGELCSRCIGRVLNFLGKGSQGISRPDRKEASDGKETEEAA